MIQALNKLKHKLMFLDIDGVLNSEKTNLIHGSWPQPANKGEVKDVYIFDPCAINLINKILEDDESYPNLRLVLSSTWREYQTVEETPWLLKNIGINPKKFLGITPMWPQTNYGYVNNNSATVRGHEIEYFLDNIKTEEGLEKLHREKLILPSQVEAILYEQFVIIDDVPTAALPKHKKNLILTDEYEGFGYKDYLNTTCVLEGIQRPEWIMKVAKRVVNANMGGNFYEESD